MLNATGVLEFQGETTLLNQDEKTGNQESF